MNNFISFQQLDENGGETKKRFYAEQFSNG